ncbi:hypothetical protein CAOG_06247 [Capsaspora owczarzaki ATCC 30864]|uniref:Phosphatidic acid phosphatase type 2/haloperoxidase domain-containing protein n=1 Tax=Capsaspora owczarzaki (strain ATCC 30864) TaxID=595528 RepID=A0A0D2WUW5_CAPO3|nr:hypothetical protein CAOG_06247 [Capsaspora owczarzaki ATCC 30864]KJE95843.1 hypothetical protein CAOG_006247 [Capsaspora owczarzaki ATCC 30864]|eukprot:XP_004344996.2 hypothetical protein CAOG_06247 [Capsaspora owczarzaki ATCC 30864]
MKAKSGSAPSRSATSSTDEDKPTSNTATHAHTRTAHDAHNSRKTTGVWARIGRADKAMSARIHTGDTFMRPLLVALEFSGHGIPWIAGAVVAFLLTAHSELLANLLAGLALDLVVVGLVKAIVRRPRPSYNVDDMFATVSVDRFSFPSGHTTRVAMLAAFVFFLANVGLESQTVMEAANTATAPTSSSSNLLPAFVLSIIEMVNISLFVIVWAVVVAISRVMLGRHHVGDVAAGIVIGVAQFLVLRHFIWIPAHHATYMQTTALDTINTWKASYL